MSFVMAKSSDTRPPGSQDGVRTVCMSLGILDRGLQKHMGCRLPSFDFTLTLQMGETEGTSADAGAVERGCRDVRAVTLLVERIGEVIESVVHSDAEVVDSIASFGSNLPQPDGGWIEQTKQYPAHSFLNMEGFRHGIFNIAQNIIDVLHPMWGKVAFRVLLTKLRHAHFKNDDLENAPPIDESEKETLDGAQLLMKELKEELPINYIHIPSTFDFTVDSERITFGIWQNRLIELTKFVVRISTRKYFSLCSIGDYSWVCEPDGYDMRVYAGFDPKTVTNPEKSKCTLYIYSRQSGRLIKFVEDARTTLRVNASGSDYCQGLTILVDDIDGHLPLNPTKQDIAFGEQAGGHIHEKNLYAWVGAICDFYYKYHLKKTDEGTKTALHEQVQDAAEEAKEIIRNSGKDWCDDLVSANLTTFSGLTWRRMRGPTIRYNYTKAKENLILIHHGSDTRFRLWEDGPDKYVERGQLGIGKAVKLKRKRKQKSFDSTVVDRKRRATITATGSDSEDTEDEEGEEENTVEAFMKNITDKSIQLKQKKSKSQKKSPKKCKNCSSRSKEILALTTKTELMESQIDKLHSQLRRSNKSEDTAMVQVVELQRKLREQSMLLHTPHVTSSSDIVSASLNNSGTTAEAESMALETTNLIKKQRREIRALKQQNRTLDAMMRGMIAQQTAAMEKNDDLDESNEKMSDDGSLQSI